MQDVFNSAVDWFYISTTLIVWLVFPALGYVLHKKLQSKAMVALLLAVPGLFVLGLPVWLLLSTQYTITNDTLNIRSGPVNVDVDIQSITSITPTRSTVSSPALSLDRLEIRYGDDKKILVSPKDKDGFIKRIDAVKAASQG